jgi:hypothetical protein
MSSVWTKARKNTPEIDCGLCGFTTCGAYARSVIVGNTEISGCPILKLKQFAEQRTSLEAVARDAKNTQKPAPEQPEGGVLLSKPCMDAPELLMAEMRIFNGVNPGDPMKYGVLDPAILCWLLDCVSSRYQDMKCSKELAYAWGDMEETKVHILRDGRVRMRRAKGAEHALESFKIIERTVMGAIICNCCGNDLFTVLSGFMQPIGAKHTVLEAGSTLSLNQDLVDWTPQKESPKSESITKMTNLVDELHLVLMNHLELMISSNTPLESIQDIRSKICNVISLMVESMIEDHDVVFLRGLTLAYFIGGAMSGLNSLNEMLVEGQIDKALIVRLLKDAMKMSLHEQNFDSISESDVIPFAQSSRVERAIRLFDEWKKN